VAPEPVEGRFAELWAALEGLHPELVHRPPGTFKLGKKTIAKFDARKGTATIHLPGGKLGWAFEGDVSADDAQRFVATMRDALGLPEATVSPTEEPGLADLGEDDWGRALPLINDVMVRSSDDVAYEELRRAWKKWKHPEVRRSLATALALHPRADFLELIRPAFHSDDPILVLHAVMAVGLARRGGAKDLVTLASHELSNVRHAVAQALGDVGGEAEVAVLGQLLVEKDSKREPDGADAWKIRQEAAKSLARIGAGRSLLEAQLAVEKHKTAKKSIERALAGKDLAASYRLTFKVLGFSPN
jgi:hypothetical protein